MQQWGWWLLTSALPGGLSFARGGQPRHASAGGGAAGIQVGLTDKLRHKMLCTSNQC